MEMLIAEQLGQFAEIGARVFTGYTLVFMCALFALQSLLLCKQAHALRRVVTLLCTSFSEAAMSHSPMLRTYWSEYARTFMHDLQENNKTVYQALDFFSPQRILHDALYMRWWKFAPQVFFLLGMIAVLAHLTYGLALFDITSPEAIMESIKQAFLAVANGLVLLAAGVLLSLAMYFLVRRVISGLTRRIEEFAALLDKRYRITRLEERELTLAEYAKTLTRIVTTLFADAPGARALTPGVLSKELLMQMKEINAGLKHVVAVLQPERLELLGAQTGRAVAEALRPGQERAPQLGATAGAEDLAALAGALLHTTRVLQDYLNDKCREEETLQLEKTRGPKQ